MSEKSEKLANRFAKMLNDRNWGDIDPYWIQLAGLPNKEFEEWVEQQDHSDYSDHIIASVDNLREIFEELTDDSTNEGEV